VKPRIQGAACAHRLALWFGLQGEDGGDGGATRV
jgi:hypothetical protein